MIGLDTNVLIRIFVDDTPEHTAAARALLSDAARNGVRICLVVLIETIWTMRRSFGFGRAAIAEFVIELLDRPEFDIERRDLVEQALETFLGTRRIDFPDCLIAAANVHSGCRETYTFDMDAADIGHFTLLTLKA